MKSILKSAFLLCTLSLLIVVGCKKNDPGKSCNNAAHAGYTSLDSDACGDGVNASLLDGTRLEYKYDAASDSLWFLLTVNSISSSQPIGVNVLVNIPNGGSTFNFWGKDDQDAYNRLLTVWVTGTAPVAYSGIIGIADAAGVATGNGGTMSGYTDLSQNNISVNVNTSNKTILLGLRRADLIPDSLFTGNTITIKIAAAVGSNAAYNDDIYHSNTNMTLTKAAPVAGAPVLTTTTYSNVTSTGAATGGNITSDGGNPITARGVVVATHFNPTLTDVIFSSGTGTGSFATTLSGLTANTTYYIRAYATNGVGTSYGNSVVFTTSGASVSPSVTTQPVTGVGTTSATGGGNITTDGGQPVTDRGTCWSSTHSNPTTADSKTSDGTGAGIFTSAITGLTGSTTYHVRAYATNSIGTSYGVDATFTTIGVPTVPQLTTTTPSSVADITATSGASISSDGGSPITARGVCWSTTALPTVINSTTSDGTGPGSFTSAVTGLTQNTTYYIRAYATNGIGTAYGNQLTFTTARSLGSTGPAGGLVFYDKGITSNGWRYLEASLSDQSATLQYQSCYGVVVNASGKIIGTGQANTQAIIAGCSSSATYQAANACTAYNGGGYTDWYQPSRDEMQSMNDNLYNNGLGSFNANTIYWTSSEVMNLTAWVFQIGQGPSTTNKNMQYSVRAIRQF